MRRIKRDHLYGAAMRQALKLHPNSRCTVVTRIEVEVARLRPGALGLRYVVTGKVSDLRMARAAAPARADELWRRTCFEAFVRAGAGEAYTEFNFAPSTQWAVYHFSGYREGMEVASEAAAPRIEMQASAERYEMRVSLGLPGDGAWRLGLSAVIEETSGAKSYWALAHPPGKPDFHHADGFVLELA